MAEDFSSSTHPTHPPHGEDERLAWLRLLRSRRVGAATFYRLMDEAGSAAGALEMLPEVARAAGVENYLPCTAEAARAELRAGRLAGARLIAIGEAEYPLALATIPDPPPLLWTIGDLSLLDRPSLALVGARNASSLGTRMARALAEDLGRQGLAVVSGLAKGVDTAAHLGALSTGTVAVMAGGVDVIYPPENAVLAQEIADRGLRLSDQPMGLVPTARHFPRRNRIVAGLSMAVVVVEAAARSGSLITAREALDLGREVMAVPGHPMDPRASGCNMLLRDGAVLVRHAEDVVDALAARPQPERPAEPARLAAPAEDRDAGEVAGDAPATEGPSDRAGVARAKARIIEIPRPGQRRSLAETAELHRMILARLGPAPLAEDQLIRDLGVGANELGQELVNLELDGKIERRAGGLLALLT